MTTPNTDSSRDELAKIVRTISRDDNAAFYPEGYVDRLQALIDREVLKARKKQPLGTCIDCMSIIIDMSTLDYNSAATLTKSNTTGEGK